MELIIEQVAIETIEKIIKELAPQKTDVFFDRESGLADIFMQDDNGWSIHTYNKAVVIYKNEVVVGSRMKQIILSNNDYDRIVIQ